MNSAEYQAIVKAYTNKKGEISYELLNKALIQAARSNPYVAELVARSASEAEIRDHVVKANFEAVTGNRSISQAEVNAILELLDAVSLRASLSSTWKSHITARIRAWRSSTAGSRTTSPRSTGSSPRSRATT